MQRGGVRSAKSRKYEPAHEIEQMSRRCCSENIPGPIVECLRNRFCPRRPGYLARLRWDAQRGPGPIRRFMLCLNLETTWEIEFVMGKPYAIVLAEAYLAGELRNGLTKLSDANLRAIYLVVRHTGRTLPLNEEMLRRRRLLWIPRADEPPVFYTCNEEHSDQFAAHLGATPVHLVEATLCRNCIRALLTHPGGVARYNVTALRDRIVDLGDHALAELFQRRHPHA